MANSRKAKKPNELKKGKTFRGRTESLGTSIIDPHRAHIKIMHNDELKKFSQSNNQISLESLKYKILLGFNYIESDGLGDVSFQNEDS